MSKIHVQSNQNFFFCPGCNCAHGFNNRWTWNGDKDNPTISPSLLSWGETSKCHSFIKNGKIQFLNDCSHSLKGTTIEVPDWEKSLGIK